MTHDEERRIYEKVLRESVKSIIADHIAEYDHDGEKWDPYMDELADEFIEQMWDDIFSSDAELDYIHGAMATVAERHGLEDDC